MVNPTTTMVEKRCETSKEWEAAIILTDRAGYSENKKRNYAIWSLRAENKE